MRAIGQHRDMDLERRQTRTLLKLAHASACPFTQLAARDAETLIAQGYPALARRKLIANLAAEARGE